MKNVLLAITFIFGPFAWSCPNLAGTYTCDYADGTSYSYAISQKTNDSNVVEYTFTRNHSTHQSIEVYVTDGKNRDNAIATCQDNVFKIKFIFPDEPEFTSFENYSKEGDALKYYFNGKVEYTSVCSKK